MFCLFCLSKVPLTMVSLCPSLVEDTVGATFWFFNLEEIFRLKTQQGPVLKLIKQSRHFQGLKQTSFHSAFLYCCVAVGR